MVQTAIVALIVVGACAYSAWALMPAAWQRGLRRLFGLEMPVDAGGCSGCSGCGGGCAAPRQPGSAGPPGSAASADSASPAPALPVVTLHRRLPASGKVSGGASSRPFGQASGPA
jgi:hypothetical protein